MVKLNNQTKPKILVFIYNSTSIGGPTTSMRLLINSMLQEEYEFKEIFIDEKLGKKPQFKLLIKLVKEIRAFNPNIIHISGLQLHGFYATLATRLAGYKNILLVVRGSSTSMIDFPLFYKWLFGRVIEPITLRLSRVVYAVSKEMGESKLVRKNAKKFGGIIHNAIPEVSFDESDRDLIRQELNLSNSDVLVVYTGRITKEKGLNYALEAFKEIDNAKFIICGTGLHFEEFKQTYKKEIEMRKLFFLGNRTDIVSILSGADIFLFPTLHENLSNSLLEACAVGLPIIATNVGGNPEIVLNNVNGILVNPKDTRSIIESLNLLINDENKRKSMGKMAKKIGNSNFSQEIIFTKVSRLYQEILDFNS